MNTAALESTLAKQGPAPLYAVVGEEDWLREQAVAALKAAVLGGPSVGVGDGMEVFNYDLLYADESDATEILERAGQAPVFAARRCVIVKSAEKVSPRDGDALLAYLKEPCETTTLVFVAAKLDKRLKFTKELLEHAVAVDCSSFPEAQLTEWIRAESGRQGVRLGPEAVGALSRLALSLKGEAGGSLNLLRREMEKLAAYVPSGKTAGVQEVEAVRGGEPGASVFDLASAIAARREGQALWILARNLDSGEDPLRILGALAWQFRQIWKAKDQRWRGGSGAELSGAFTDRDLGTAVELFAAADAKLKGGASGSSKRLVLETAVLALCRFQRDAARGTQARDPALSTQDSGLKGTRPWTTGR